MEYKDYYGILGVNKGASEKEIKSSFRKLARKHHPDVNPDDPQAEERFKEINEAYEVLRDKEKRQKDIPERPYFSFNLILEFSFAYHHARQEAPQRHGQSQFQRDPGTPQGDE